MTRLLRKGEGRPLRGGLVLVHFGVTGDLFGVTCVLFGASPTWMCRGDFANHDFVRVD